MRTFSGVAALGCLVSVLIAGATSPISADLVSHWTFDGSTEDVGPGANDGTFMGFDEIYVEGYDGTFDGALQFNGIDDYVLVAHNSGLPLYDNPQFSVAMWVKGIPQNDKRVWSESSSTNNSALFNLGTHNTAADGTFDLFVRDATGAAAANHFHSLQEPFGIEDEWHHIAWIDDNGIGTLYVDGARDGAVFNYGRPDLTAGDPLVAIDTTTIGGILRGVATCCLFTGALDDVQVFDHALTAQEVLDISGFGEGCPVAGDTHAGTLEVTGPDGNLPGSYEAVVTGSTNDNVEPFTYLFRADNGAGSVFQQGPKTDNFATFVLGVGTWTVSVQVDDDPVCLDQAVDAIKEEVVEVVASAPQLVGYWPLDGELDDISGNENHGLPQTGFDPLYGPDKDGDDPGAVDLNGFDDVIVVTQTSGLPLYNNDAFSIAMWVKGGPQPDFRVWSEASSTSRVPLFNIGTENTGTNGSVDLYIRDDSNATALNHVHSTREAFDNTWHHIAWVDDNGAAVLYIDGIPDETDFSYVRPQMTLDTTTIGGILRDTPSHWFLGQIDDVRVYNYALTEEEVQELVTPLDECPAVGDTECDDGSIAINDAPVGDIAGSYTFEALDAQDASGDAIFYSWRATDGVREITSGPSRDAIWTVALGSGEWTISVFVDDNLICPDVGPNSTCTRDIVVNSIAGDWLSQWQFDGDTLDSQPAENHGTFVGGLDLDPTYTTGQDGTPGGALLFDGVDDYVQVEQFEDLPLYENPAFTIAMWVKGLPQPDRRIWSESRSDVSLGNPLWNLGTAQNGLTGSLDFYLRDGSGAVVANHVLSTAQPFDGEWHHVAWSDEAGFVTLYVDGVPDETNFNYARPEMMELDVTTIGGILRAASCCWFGGEIDDVRVFTYALDQEEVSAVIGDEPPPGVSFLRGDCNVDGSRNLTDGVFLLNFLFLGGPASACPAACDYNADGSLNITTAVFLFNFLFLGGPAPPAPSDACGPLMLAGDIALGCADVGVCNN